jgi:hypothetical protein
MTYRDWQQHPNDFLVIRGDLMDANGVNNVAYLIVEYESTGRSISNIIDDKKLRDHWTEAMIAGGVLVVTMNEFSENKLAKTHNFRLYQAQLSGNQNIPGFMLFVRCELDHITFTKQFLTEIASSEIRQNGVSSARFGLNNIEVNKNNNYDPDKLDAVDGFLYYPHKIIVYRYDPLPEKDALIAEQLDLCRSLLHPIVSQGWQYHIRGGVAKYL